MSTRPTFSTTWRVARRHRSCRWISRKRSGGCPTARDRCSYCTISKGIVTKRSPTCWGSWPARRNRNCIMPAWRSAGISSAEGAATMNDQWTARLSEYLDGEVTPAEQTALEAHLASCDACRTTLEELRRVVTNARALDDRPPTADLWPSVAARIARSARHGHGTRDRAEPENHRPGDPRRAERTCGGPREFISESAPRPRDAA